MLNSVVHVQNSMRRIVTSVSFKEGCVVIKPLNCLSFIVDRFVHWFTYTVLPSISLSDALKTSSKIDSSVWTKIAFDDKLQRHVTWISEWIHFTLTRDGDICKHQNRYHIDIFFTMISIYRYDIDISHLLKKTYFKFFMKYTVTHVPNDHTRITWRHWENYVRQKYMHFSSFGEDPLNGKVVNEKGNW